MAGLVLAMQHHMGILGATLLVEKIDQYKPATVLLENAVGNAGLEQVRLQKISAGELVPRKREPGYDSIIENRLYMSGIRVFLERSPVKKTEEAGLERLIKYSAYHFYTGKFEKAKKETEELLGAYADRVRRRDAANFELIKQLMADDAVRKPLLCEIGTAHVGLANACRKEFGAVISYPYRQYTMPPFAAAIDRRINGKSADSDFIGVFLMSELNRHMATAYGMEFMEIDRKLIKLEKMVSLHDAESMSAHTGRITKDMDLCEIREFIKTEGPAIILEWIEKEKGIRVVE